MYGIGYARIRHYHQDLMAISLFACLLRIKNSRAEPLLMIKVSSPSSPSPTLPEEVVTKCGGDPTDINSGVGESPDM